VGGQTCDTIISILRFNEFPFSHYFKPTPAIFVTITVLQPWRIFSPTFKRLEVTFFGEFHDVFESICIIIEKDHKPKPLCQF
jgi:hypothetical protein